MSIIADFMESWSDRMKLRIMVLILAGLVASTVAACNETRYLVWGKTVNAKVEKVMQVTTRGRYGSTSEKIRVEYSFPDGDLGTRKEEDDVSTTFFDAQEVANDGVVDVQYLPGTLERSRLAGHTYTWLVWPFAVCVVVAGVFGYNFWIEFKDHERRSKATAELYKR